jgi:hypothetical protein
LAERSFMGEEKESKPEMVESRILSDEILKPD